MYRIYVIITHHENGTYESPQRIRWSMLILALIIMEIVKDMLQYSLCSPHTTFSVYNLQPSTNKTTVLAFQSSYSVGYKLRHIIL